MSDSRALDSADALPHGAGEAARPGRGINRRIKLGPALLGWLLPAAVALAWEAAAAQSWLPRHLFPPPSAVFAAVLKMARSGELVEHIAATLTRVGLGFAAGVAAATVLGALAGYLRLFRQLADPTLQSLRNIPSIAWVPLFVLWLGIGETPKVALIAVGVFFPVYLALVSGIDQVDRKLVEVGRVYRLSGWGLVRRVLLPATLPAYVTGLRGGLGLGWMFVVAAEIMGASEGLGFLLIDGQMTGRVPAMLGALVLFALFGKATDLILVHAGGRLVSWQDSFANARPNARS